MFKRIGKFLLFSFIIFSSYTFASKTKLENRLKLTSTTKLDGNTDENDELGGTIFDDMDSPDEETSNKLNDDAKEIGETGSNDEDTLFEKEQQAKRLKEEEARKKAEEEATMKKAEEEEEAKRKAEEEARKKAEEEAKRKTEEEARRKAEEEAEKLEQKEKDNIENLTYPNIPLEKVHYPIKEKTNSKAWIKAIGTFILFSICYLLFRLIFNSFKKCSKFFSICFASLSNQLFLFIIGYIIITLTYIYGNFDSIAINWEYLLSGIALFTLSWIFFSSILIILCSLIVKGWKDQEASSLNFTNLRHEFGENENQRYDRSQNHRNYSSLKNKKVLYSFEFLILKRFFYIPLFPLFKASSFLKEMKFSFYLENCLIQQLKLFFKFSITSWIIYIVIIMCWNVFIAPSSILCITIISITFPILGLLVLVFIYIYLIRFYRKIVEEINENNIANYQDIEYDSTLAFKSFGYPVYLKEFKENPKRSSPSNNTFHEYLYQRPPSLYENLMLLGQVGFQLILNSIQAICLVFITWIIIVFAKHLSYIMKSYSKWILVLLIIALILYFALHVIFTTLVLKWYTIINSVEMNRNEKSMRKMINQHLKKAGKISNEIFCNFKSIYYKKKIADFDSDDMKLGFKNLQELIKFNVERYYHFEGQKPKIHIQSDLIPFLKTFGCPLTGRETEFMFRLIENYNGLKEEIEVEDLYDVYGAILHFRTQKPFAIYKYVFDTYIKEKSKNKKNPNISFQVIEGFLNLYNTFFTQEQKDFLKAQCDSLGESFSLDSLVFNLVSFRQYYPF